MTQEAQAAVLTWVFGGMAVIGAYCLVVFPVLYMHHLHRRYKTPQPKRQADMNAADPLSRRGDEIDAM